MRGIIFSIGLALAIVASGCVERDLLYEPEYAGEAAPAADSNDDSESSQVDVTYEGPIEPTPLRASSNWAFNVRDVPRPDPVFFHLGAGHGTLGNVDLEPCRDRGLPPGYLHMRVTFRPSGHVSHAALESGEPPPAEALACVGRRLKRAVVPPFDGEDVTLSRVFFVN